MLNWVNQIMIIVLLDIYEVVRVKCLKTKSSLNNLTFPSKKIVTPFVQPLQIDKRGPYRTIKSKCSLAIGYTPICHFPTKVTFRFLG